MLVSTEMVAGPTRRGAGPRRAARELGLALFGLLVLTAFAPVPVVLAHANLVRAEPGASKVVATAPEFVQLWFSEAPERRYSEIAVYNAQQQRFDTGGVQPLPGDASGLQVRLTGLPDGVYTVVWKATSSVDGHTTSGSFAFAVGNLPPPPPPGESSISSTVTPATPLETGVKWLTLVAATVLVGALGLGGLVWTPVLRLPGTAQLRGPVWSRLVALAGCMLVVLFVSSAFGLVVQAGKATSLEFGAVLTGGVLSPYLLETRAGSLWLARLLLPLVGLLFLGPQAIRALRGAPAPASREGAEADAADQGVALPALFAGALGVCYLITLSLGSHGAASGVWPQVTIALDVLHLLATAVWLGGLSGLVLTVPLARQGPGQGRALLGALLGRFSPLALASVVVLSLTGLYSAWLHVGSLAALRETSYGQTLLVKLAFVAALVAIGAVQRWWVRPGLAAGDAAEGAGGLLRPGRVRALLLAEVLLGGAVLLVVALLTGLVPGREALVAARQPQRVQTQPAGDLRVTLSLASLQPEETTIDVLLRVGRTGQPVADAERVAVRLVMLTMDMGEAEVLAAPVGGGHYQARGAYLPMSGTWQLRVLVRRTTHDDVDTAFTFQIGSAANQAAEAAKVTAPRLPSLTGQRGMGLASIVLATVLGSAGIYFFRRSSGLGTLFLMLVPALVVVGSYLLLQPEPTLLSVARGPEPGNPVQPDAASVARGQTLFATNCVSCHGPAGRGDGPSAVALNPRPPSFADPHTASHSDGYLFNVISNGSPGSAMPSWSGQLSEEARWDLVNYVRTLNPLTAPPGVGASPATTPALAPAGTPPAASTPVVARGGTPGTPTSGVAGVTTPVASPVARSTPIPPNGLPSGRLIYVSDGYLWALDVTGGRPTNLTPDLKQNSYALDPALSPDGTTLAYTVVALPPPGQAGALTLPVNELYLMDLASGASRTLIGQDKPGALISRPVWTPDGKALLFGYSAPVFAADGRYLDTARELVRYDIATGQRVSLVQGAVDPTVTGTGSAARLAYVAVEPATGQPSLMLANADGTEPRKLLTTTPEFLAINAPRFSPDGTRLVFAGAGGPTQASVAPDHGGFWGWLGALFRTQSAAAHGHGLPGHIWTVALDGSTLTRLTREAEDDPVPTWSPDGARVAFVSGQGVSIVGADGSGLVRLLARGSAGTVAWAPR